mmetsp:Transcript_22993/g.20428  ORF Transcript_22993/g.20428 Transcript_22993/m.20428 type:complete len:182 (+) Transcript_22993:402-947(+)
MIDANAILNSAFQSETIDPDNIYLFGASMGGAAAIESAKHYQDRLKGLILMNTFTNLANVVDQMNIIFKLFRPIILSNYWPSEERISELTLPIQFISGREDEMISKEQMDRLFKAATSSRYKDMTKVKHGHHNDTWYSGREIIRKSLKKFFKKCQQLFLQKQGTINLDLSMKNSTNKREDL